YANVVLYNMDNTLYKGLTTDINGTAEFIIQEKVKYEVSFMGYANKSGEISPGENITVKMAVDAEILDAVVVTGLHTSKRADQSIYKIDVVNSVQLEERGVSNLADALSNESNIRIRVDPTTGTSIEMNGMGGENIKYLIDGIPIMGRVDGNIDLSQINMDNVDHIEIVEGPMSVVYGTSALAGVINIITKQNSKNRNSLKANTYIDNKNNYNVGASGSIIRGKNTFSLSAQRNLFQGYDINMTQPGEKEYKDRYMEFNPKLVYNIDADYLYRKNDFSMRLKSSFMNTKVVMNSNPDTLVNGLASDDYYYTTRSTSSITVNDKLSEKVSYNIIGAYTYYGRHTDKYKKNLRDTISKGLDILEDVIISNEITWFNNYMTRGNFTYTPYIDKLSFQFGWDINHDNGEGDRIKDGKKEMSDIAAFASAQWNPTDKLSIQPGLRYIYNTEFDAPIAPSINFQYQFLENLSARLSYAKGFRTPSLKELYLNFIIENIYIHGNDSLKAEYTDSYNASILYKIKGESFLVKIEPSAFYNHGKNKIYMQEVDGDANKIEGRYDNLGETKNFGFNFNATFLHFGGLTASIGYSGSGEYYKEEEEAEFNDLQFYSNYTLNAKYNFHKLKLILMANYKYYGITPYLITNESTDELYYVYKDPYSDLEVTASKMFWKNKLSVVVGAKNLFDNYYSTTRGYEDRIYTEMHRTQNYGRTFFVRMNIKFSN
ncbi:MAG: TonB-dependent receptor, partial [Chlamydiia bacterium]|nr:TonB-dependent receptor [Chlamydiia bacterium]